MKDVLSINTTDDTQSCLILKYENKWSFGERNAFGATAKHKDNCDLLHQAEFHIKFYGCAQPDAHNIYTS